MLSDLRLFLSAICIGMGFGEALRGRPLRRGGGARLVAFGTFSRSASSAASLVEGVKDEVSSVESSAFVSSGAARSDVPASGQPETVSFLADVLICVACGCDGVCGT